MWKLISLKRDLFSEVLKRTKIKIFWLIELFIYFKKFTNM